MKNTTIHANALEKELMEQIGATSNQVKRLRSEWERIAKEWVEVEEIKGAFYGFGSELATLRLLKKYTANGQTANKKVRADYSKGRNSFFFVLET